MSGYDEEFRQRVERDYERELDRMGQQGRDLAPQEASFLYAVHAALLLGNYGLAERLLLIYRGKRPKHWVSDWLTRPAPENTTLAGLRAALADIKRLK